MLQPSSSCVQKIVFFYLNRVFNVRYHVVTIVTLLVNNCCSVGSAIDLHFIFSFKASNCLIDQHQCSINLSECIESEAERTLNWSSYKLLVDPLLDGGKEKLYRYDGLHFSTPVSFN